MKKYLFLAMVLSVGTFVACGDDSSSGPSDSTTTESSSSTEEVSSSAGEKTTPDENVSSSSGEASTTKVSAFFPEGYDADKVVAWYVTDEIVSEEKGQTRTLVDAVYLFEDGTFIVGEQKVKTKNKISTYENEVVAEGTWVGSKDNVKNGSLTIVLHEMKVPIQIKNGKFTISPFGDESLDFTLVESAVPDAEPVTKENDSGEKDNRDGTAEQLEWAKSIIARSKSTAASGIEFEISEPTWEKLNAKDDLYNATFTVKVTLTSGEFYSGDGLEYPVVAIGQYPVHAINSEKDALPEQWNNNNWEIEDGKIVGKTMTVKITEKIDNLKIGRAYVYYKDEGALGIGYSEAFFIVPPSYQGDL